jgi:hypothetical protein
MKPERRRRRRKRHIGYLPGDIKPAGTAPLQTAYCRGQGVVKKRRRRGIIKRRFGFESVASKT